VKRIVTVKEKSREKMVAEKANPRRGKVTG
jgi:hypothetical protein